MSIFRKFQNDTREIWNTINQLKQSYNENSNTAHVYYQDDKLTDPLHAANAFSEFYTNLALNLDGNKRPSSTDPLTFLWGDHPSSMAALSTLS